MADQREYTVTYRSRYYPFEGDHKRRVYATSKKEIRSNWHSIIHTDEYSIVSIDEVKR